MWRAFVILITFCAAAGCQSSAAPSAPTRPAPISRQFESRLATQDEVERAIAIVRAHETLRGRSHHMGSVARDPDDISWLIVNNDIRIHWSLAWQTRPLTGFVSYAGDDFKWVGDIYDYVVNLETSEVRVTPDYWLHDAAPYGVYVSILFHSYVPPKADLAKGDSPPGDIELISFGNSIPDLSPRALADDQLNAAARAIAIVRAKETLAGDPRRIKIVTGEPAFSWAYAAGVALLIWHEPTDHPYGYSSGALHCVSNEHIYVVTLATNEFSYRVDWFSFPPAPEMEEMEGYILRDRRGLAHSFER